MMNKKTIQNLKATQDEDNVWLLLSKLQEKGYITEIKFQPKKYVLNECVKKRFYTVKILENNKKKIRKSEKCLIREHKYTPDFYVQWTQKALEDKIAQLINDEELNNDIPFIANHFTTIDDIVDNEPIYANYFFSIFEVKPNYDSYNTERMFRAYIQPIIWNKYRLYVQLVKYKQLYDNEIIKNIVK